MLNRCRSALGSVVCLFLLFVVFSCRTGGGNTDSRRYAVYPPDIALQAVLPIAPDPQRSLGSDTEDWFRDAVFYHIWINAFHDSDGDGIGDIRGITLKLDYLRQLGVNALWLSPFFESASSEINLHMYDTIDHYRVDPRFGSNADMDELLAEAHRRGIRLIFDWVPNHVSVRHPWFVDSAAGAEGKADWFVWRDEPGSQTGPMSQKVWHRHANGRYYYAVFWDGMPDINFRNQAARDAISSVALYWLNRGFDGIRIDAVKYLYEDPAAQRGGYVDHPDNYQYFHMLRREILDRYAASRDRQGLPLHKFMVAENWTSNLSNLQRYMVNEGQPAFQMTLDFPFAEIMDRRDLGRLQRHWTWQSGELAEGSYMASFLSNHDDAAIRPASRHREPILRAATALQLLGPGVPFIYYGNEIGMLDASQFAGGAHADRRHRQPFLWSLASRQAADPGSLLSFYRELIAVRQARVSIRRGSYQHLANDSRSIAFARSLSGQTSLVLANLSDQTAVLEFDLAPELAGLLTDSILEFGDLKLSVVSGGESGSAGIRLRAEMGPGAVRVFGN